MDQPSGGADLNKEVMGEPNTIEDECFLLLRGTQGQQAPVSPQEGNICWPDGRLVSHTVKYHTSKRSTFPDFSFELFLSSLGAGVAGGPRRMGESMASWHRVRGTGMFQCPPALGEE